MRAVASDIVVGIGDCIAGREHRVFSERKFDGRFDRFVFDHGVVFDRRCILPSDQLVPVPRNWYLDQVDLSCRNTCICRPDGFSGRGCFGDTC